MSTRRAVGFCCDRNDHKVQLARLHNLGVLVDHRSTGGSRHTPTDDFTYCLDF